MPEIKQSHTFPKSQRLNQEKEISELFKNGSFFYLYPFKVYYQATEVLGTLPKVLISAPKSRFKKAVDRNLIKRRIKEAYRLNKNILIGASQNVNCNISNLAIVYNSKKIHEFAVLEDKLKIALSRLFATKEKSL